jgi:uncharacterized Zn-finger protein
MSLGGRAPARCRNAKLQRPLPQGVVAGAAQRQKTSIRPWISVAGLGIDGARRYGGALPAAAAATQIRDRSADEGLSGPKDMADRIVPHFHNTPGVAVIEIGAKEFMCEGELAPFDHPHVFLDMGDANEIICPYCSTLFRHDPTLDPHAARPPECALPESATA